MIAVLAASNDRHAAVVMAAIRARHGVETCLIENDALAGNGLLHWVCGGDAAIPTSRGKVLLRDVRTIWNRRPVLGSHRPLYPHDSETQEFVDSECAWGLNGALLSFGGRWVSDPRKASEASNKLHQLACAARVGLRVPKTIVSQAPAEIRAFARAHGGKVIVKEIRGTRKTTATTRFNPGHPDEVLAICPAIFQECVQARLHLRVLSLGSEHHAVAVESEDLDWRFNLNKSMNPYSLSSELENRLSALLSVLGLEMGVLDLIVTDDDDPVFLEVNPQGQFLFVEGLSGVPLTAALADYLVA